MKFKDKYPDAKHLQEVELGIFYHNKSESCWHCGTETNFCEMEFQAPFCSEECLKAKWIEYLKAYNRSDNIV